MQRSAAHALPKIPLSWPLLVPGDTHHLMPPCCSMKRYGMKQEKFGHGWGPAVGFRDIPGGLKKKKGMKDLTQVLVIFLINNFLHSHHLSLFNLCCVRRPPSKREELRGSHLDVGLQLYSTAWHPDLSSTSSNAVIMAMASTTMRMIWVRVIGIRMRDNLQQPIDELRSRPPC